MGQSWGPILGSPTLPMSVLTLVRGRKVGGVVRFLSEIMTYSKTAFTKMKLVYVVLCGGRFDLKWCVVGIRRCRVRLAEIVTELMAGSEPRDWNSFLGPQRWPWTRYTPLIFVSSSAHGRLELLSWLEALLTEPSI